MTEPSLPAIETEEFVAPKTDAPNKSQRIRDRFKNKPASSPREKRSEPPSRPGEFVEPIEKLYTTVAVFAIPFDQQCASAILQVDQQEKIIQFDGTETDNPNYGKSVARLCAESLDKAAQTNDSLRKVLRMLTTGGTWGAVVAAHAPIIMAVMAHHAPFMKPKD